MSLLRTVELRKRFGALNACDGVNFTVEKGEFLSLVGSNGAGKTTLVNLITAHLQPDSGQVLFEERDITGLSVSERIKAGIARSFQLVNLFDGLSVFDNVALAIFAREGKTAKIAALAANDDDVRRETREVLASFSTLPSPTRCAPNCCSSTSRRAGSAAPRRRRSWILCPRSCVPGRSPQS